MPKTWAEKMENPAEPEVKILDKGFADIPAGAKMLIPTPKLIASYLQSTSPGQSVDLRQMRADLAAGAGAVYTCPLTTGIFLRILTEYTHEQKMMGNPTVSLSPVWRVVNPRLPLWKKLSFDPSWILEFRKKESITS